MKALFEMGVSFRTFLLNQSDENRNKFTKYYITLSIKQKHKDRIKAINSPVNILGVVEGSCEDCQTSLSVLEKLVSTNGSIQLRLITRNDADEQLADYKVNGNMKTPTFIFMDENFNIKGSFIEKPSILKDADTTEGSKLQVSMLTDAIADELVELIEKTAVRS